MSAFPDDPLHFATWAKSDPIEFLPRQLYAEDLSNALRLAHAEAKAGVALEVRHDEVIDITDNPCSLHLGSGEWMWCERVVLARLADALGVASQGAFSIGPMRRAELVGDQRGAGHQRASRRTGGSAS
jgi:hypothetical protein